jgi:nitroreductase
VDFAALVRRRRMVRRYRDQPVEPQVLNRVLHTALRGPSAGFSQGQHLVVVTAAETRQAIARLCREPEFVAGGREPWLSMAPVHVVPCVRPDDYCARYAEPDKARSRGPDRWEVPHWFVDGGACLMLLLLAAVDEGLGAGFLDVPDPQALRGVLAIPDDVIPLGLVTLGHPAGEQPAGSAARGRRPAGEVVHRGRWEG